MGAHWFTQEKSRIDFLVGCAVGFDRQANVPMRVATTLFQSFRQRRCMRQQPDLILASCPPQRRLSKIEKL